MLKKVFSIVFYIGAGFFLLPVVIMFFIKGTESIEPVFWIFLLFSVCLGLIGYGISMIGKQKEYKGDSFREAQEYAKQFTDKQIQGILIQVLETFHILRNTKNIETYKSRWGFLEEKIEQLYYLYSSYNYKNNVVMGAQRYAELYPERDVQKSYLFNVNDFDEVAFFESSFYQLVNNFIKNEHIAIKKLKTQKAKENRLLKINNFITDCLLFLRKRGYSKEDLFYNKIENLKEKI